MCGPPLFLQLTCQWKLNYTVFVCLLYLYPPCPTISGSSAVLRFLAYESGSLRWLHWWGGVESSGTRTSQELCVWPAWQTQPWVFRGWRESQVQALDKITCSSWQCSLIPDLIVSDWIFWASVWVSGSWFAWLELSSGKPRFWFWMKPLQLWTWRRTIWYSPLSELSLRTAPFWPSHIASTQSWTIQGAKKYTHVFWRRILLWFLTMF